MVYKCLVLNNKWQSRSVQASYTRGITSQFTLGRFSVTQYFFILTQNLNKIERKKSHQQEKNVMKEFELKSIERNLKYKPKPKLLLS